MHRPLWWFAVIVVLCGLLAVIVGVRLWPMARRMAVAAIVALFLCDASAVLVTAWRIDLALVGFGLAAVANLAVIAVAWRRGHLVRQQRPAWMSAAFAVGVLALVSAVTRAHDAKWPAEQAKGLFFLTVGSAFAACFVGKPTYTVMARQERSGDPRSGVHLLVAALFSGFAVIIAFVPVVLYLGGPLGFDTNADTTQHRLPRLDFLGAALALALLAAVVANRRQPRDRRDDTLRPSAPALTLAAASLTLLLVTLITAMLTVQPTIGAAWTPYWVFLGVLLAVLYVEDAVWTSVRLHDLRPIWPAWAMGALMGGTVATAMYWVVTRQFWGPSGARSGVAQIAAAISVLMLVLLAVAACGLVLAFASDPVHQQLSAKSAVSNALQGHALYVGLTLMAVLLPTQVLTRFAGNVLEKLSAIVAFGSFAYLAVWKLFEYTDAQNRLHLRSERRRDIPQIGHRRTDPAGAAGLRALFLSRLEAHIRRQQFLGGTLLAVAGAVLGVVQFLKARGEDWAAEVPAGEEQSEQEDAAQ